MPGERERYWREEVEQYRRSGVTQKAYCAKRGLALSTFQMWKRRLERKSVRFSAVSKSGKGKGRGFIPVHVIPDRSSVGAFCEIGYPDGLVVRVPRGFEEGELRGILRTARESVEVSGC